MNLGTELSRKCVNVFVLCCWTFRRQRKEEHGGLFPVLLPGVGVAVNKCTHMVTYDFVTLAFDVFQILKYLIISIRRNKSFLLSKQTWWIRQQSTWTPPQRSRFEFPIVVKRSCVNLLEVCEGVCPCLLTSNVYWWLMVPPWKGWDLGRTVWIYTFHFLAAR